MFKTISKYEKADRLSQLVIGAAIEVHRALGNQASNLARYDPKINLRFLCYLLL